jgi:23S rRNA pseudouridine2604 synthase
VTEPVRLAKRVAELKGCSRREAEQYIEGGWVTVDGQVVEEPQFRVQHQAIAIDGGASLLALAPVTLLLHKAAGVASGARRTTRPASGCSSAISATWSCRRRCRARPAGWWC